jgi:hypothetical protein
MTLQGGQSQTPAPPAKHPWIDGFIDKIKDQLQDLSYVEIVTAVAQEPGSVSIDENADQIVQELAQHGAAILARTRIELDGDIAMILPSDGQGSAKINTDILNLHKENTATAVQNWKSFLDMIIDLINTIITMTGLTKGDILDKFAMQSP